LENLASAPTIEIRPPPRRRLVKIVLWLVAVGLFWLVLDLLGVDVRGWLESLWDQIRAIPAGYVIAALVFQSGQTFFAGFAYYAILRAAYPGDVKLWPIIAAYSVGVAMNGFLPANMGTLVTLFMFVAIIPRCAFAGSLAAYLVQKIFYVLAGTFVYLYMFLSVPGAFDIGFGNETSHPALALGIVLGGAVLVVAVARIFWRQVKKLWAQAKTGGAILAKPKRYLREVFAPSFASWACKLVVVGIFLAAFAIPVTFESVIWVSGSGSLANVASFTPGAIGVTQATNALALKTCCHVPQEVAVAYSTAQQLIVTGWDQLVAIVLVAVVFGWSGGRQLVTQSYADAKRKTEEAKASRAAKRGRRPGHREAGEE
jgi:uncharacterized membrane protein YbhN (UPF0104 family)